MSRIRIILNGKVADNSALRAAVRTLRVNGTFVEVAVTWEAGDAGRLTAEAIAAATAGQLDCIVAGGGDGTVNEVFAAAYKAGLPESCCLGILPLGTANDFARANALPLHDPLAALTLAASGRSRWIDLGFLNGSAFVNLVSGGFGSRVTAETDPELKRRLGGLAYLVTGVSRFPELMPSRGSFRAEDFSWEGRFFAVAIGNARLAGGGVPLCPEALVDDGLLDLTILPELEPAARLEAFSRLLSEGAQSIRSLLVTARSSWIEYQSQDELNVNLDGEPASFSRFRAECRRRVLPVCLSASPLLTS